MLQSDCPFRVLSFRHAATWVVMLATLAVGPWITAAAAAQGVDVCELGLVGDGTADDTDALRAALRDGHKDLYFAAGRYRLGTVELPDGVRLNFSPLAKLQIVPDRLEQRPNIRIFSDDIDGLYRRWEHSASEDGRRGIPARAVLFVTGGRDVSLSGLRFDFADADNYLLDEIVHARGAHGLQISDFDIRDGRDTVQRDLTIGGKVLVKALQSRDVTLRNSASQDVAHMLMAFGCENVDVHSNRMRRGYAMTTFSAGSQWLRHHDNWSQQVRFQAVWRGGSPDPSRKAPQVPAGSAKQTHDRYLTQTDDGWHTHTQGAFDVTIQNNYAEYGVVLCWGNKGRQVVIDGNTARFMWDYAYGAEGGENHIFSNNISINSAVAGFMSLYWGEKMVVTGNLIIVRHEPFDPELAKMPFDKKGHVAPGHPEAAYFGQFLRFHHGPPNPEDLYGTGSAIVTGNLFVNELANRPSGVSIENGRDLMISGNKFVNALLRVHSEVTRVQIDATDTDEFASSQTANPAQAYRQVSRVSENQASHITIQGNEFISRQPGDKPVIIVNGSVAHAVLRDNTLRKETPHLTFTDQQIAREQSLSPRYMLYAIDDPDHRELSNDHPPVALTLAPSTPAFALVEGNLIRGWARSIQATTPPTPGDPPTWIIQGNFIDGTIDNNHPHQPQDPPTKQNHQISN